jgi:hypothetical protein
LDEPKRQKLLAALTALGFKKSECRFKFRRFDVTVHGGMSAASWMVLTALVALQACDHKAEPSPAAAASDSATPKPHELTRDDALARVRALPEVAKRLKDDPQAKAEASQAAGGFAVTVGRGKGDASEMVFVVERPTGTIRVDVDRHDHFIRGQPISLAQWRDEQRERPQAAARVAALPEVAGWEKGLEKDGLGLALWLERVPPQKGCRAGADDCAWAFYVGEAHPDHSVRRVSVLVDRESGDISVVGLDAKRVPYAEWRKTKTAALMRSGK